MPIDLDDLDDWEVIAEGVKPDAAIEFWRAKTAMTGEEVKALAEGERWRAFWVNGLTQHDQVQCVYDAFLTTLEDGGTLADFKGLIADVIRSKGWDDLRIETIYRTNMQQAYAAGRYKKMQAVKASRPFWQYLAVMDKRVRPSHAMLHEKVYPAQHPFWDVNYPPNGFRCRCAVVTLSKRQVKAQGLAVETEMPKPGKWTDPRTDAEYTVNFPGADRGWRNNPGREWVASLCQTATDKLEKSHPRVAAATVRALVEGGFDYWSRHPQGNFPLCVLKKADAEAIGAKVTVAAMSAETMRKQKDHHPELTTEDYAKAQEAVENGEKITQDERNLVFILNEPGGVVVIVKATRAGDELYVTSLRRMSSEEAKREDVIKRLRVRKSKKTDGGA